jgi:glycosyltransferase involved in cell wall biosynthesis
MKIVLVSSAVPLIHGGARFIVEWTEEQLLAHGHQVERFYLPFIDEPSTMFEQMAAFRLMDLSQSCDRLIAFRPPSHAVVHPNKVLWFIHHIRVFYDLWGTTHAPAVNLRNEALRKTLTHLDTCAIGEARKVFTNSEVVRGRIAKYNGLDAEVLYPPIHQPERFRNDGHGDEILMVSRMEPHKRPDLLVEAMRHVRSGVRLRICGLASTPAYGAEIRRQIAVGGLKERVSFDNRWIFEEEKVDRLAGALAVAYVPKDEDSYGYPSLEAAHARKAVITTTDSGGVLEMIDDGRNGFVTPPDPAAVAEAMDRLYDDRGLAARMGEANFRRISELNIDWGHVVDRLTS